MSNSECVRVMDSVPQEKYCPILVEDISDAETELAPSFDLGFNVDTVQKSSIEQNSEHLTSCSTCRPAKHSLDYHDDSSGCGSTVSKKSKPEHVFKEPLAADTHKKLHWAVNMYEEWCVQRNKHPDYAPIHASMFNISTITKLNLSYGLCSFLSEVCKVNGEEFPGKTLYEILISLQIYLEMKAIHWKLLDDSEFVNIKFTLDNLMKKCIEDGIGHHVCKAKVLLYEEEDHLWACGLLSSSNLDQMLNTLVFLIRLHCCLHTGKEHHAIRAPGFNSQFHFTFPNLVRHLVYKEDEGLKTNKGRLKHHRYEAKEVTVFPAENCEHCLVALFTKYCSLLPRNR